MSRFVIACGGTGGHTLPGIAVAEELTRRGHFVTLWLTGRDIESRTAADWRGEVFRTGAPRINKNPAWIFRGAACTRRCLRALRKTSPDALLAMGSYASLPPVIAARLLRIPVILHEANAIPGKATTFLARFAAEVAISFSESAKYFKHSTLTGLPLRQKLAEENSAANAQSAGKKSAAFTVLVTGGSQGAHALNELASHALSELPFDVIHQTGVADESAVRARYGESARVSAYISDMRAAYNAADFVIARAGAATCAELALFGKPALLIPLPSAARDHQSANAASLANAGAAIVVKQSEMSAAKLKAIIEEIAGDEKRRAAMAASAKALATPNASEAVAKLLENKKYLHKQKNNC